jgi:roadblock/LC7 domain-containing protein
MMQPPPGLKLGGNCRTHLSMGNSRAYFYDSKILAHSWAALSTDGSWGDQYLEANNCDVVCDTVGYGTYADNGCHNILNNCRITVDTHVAIIAGDAWVKFNGGTVKSNQYGAMLHGVRGHYTEVTECHITGGTWDVGEALFFVKSENVYLKVDGAQIKTGKYLLHAIVNDDDAATKVPEEMKLQVYGVNAVLANGTYIGDIVNEDTDRTMNVTIQNATVQGVITDAYISLEGSKWTATGDSCVCLVGNVQASQIDAAAGVTVWAVAGEGCDLSGEYTLASGGRLIIH